MSVPRKFIPRSQKNTKQTLQKRVKKGENTLKTGREKIEKAYKSASIFIIN